MERGLVVYLEARNGGVGLLMRDGTACMHGRFFLASSVAFLIRSFFWFLASCLGITRVESFGR